MVAFLRESMKFQVSARAGFRPYHNDGKRVLYGFCPMLISSFQSNSCNYELDKRDGKFATTLRLVGVPKNVRDFGIFQADLLGK